MNLKSLNDKKYKIIRKLMRFRIYDYSYISNTYKDYYIAISFSEKLTDHYFVKIYKEKKIIESFISSKFIEYAKKDALLTLIKIDKTIFL